MDIFHSWMWEVLTFAKNCFNKKAARSGSFFYKGKTSNSMELLH